MSAPAGGRANRTVRANRNATLLSTTSDEAARSLLPGLLTITLASSPIVLGVVEGLSGAATASPGSVVVHSARNPGAAPGSPPSATRRWPR
jgi:hypothetical protein